MGWRGLSLVAVTLLCVVVSPFQEPAMAQGSGGPGIVISEYRMRGPNGTNDEFIELFNGGAADVDVSNWRLQSSTGTGVVTGLTSFLANTRIRRGCFYLIANTVSANSVGATPDRTYLNANGTPDNGGLALLTNTGAIADQVGNGAGSAFGEGNRLPAFPAVAVNQSYERRPSNVSGFVDTNDNLADFQLIAPSTPHNSNLANCLTPVNLTVNGAVTPTSVEQGERVVIRAAVTPATLPGSTDIQVTGNLSEIGGSTTAPFADDGIAPDTVANDNIFTTEAIVPQGNPLGPRSITLNAIDRQLRRANQTISVTVTLPALLYTPHDIQGAGATTPIAIGEPVMVLGVVTGKKSNGFFLQTEVGEEDTDPNTSEGLFVPANASQLTRAFVGHLEYVKGLVAELVPDSDPGSPSITAVSDLSFIFDLGVSPMPPAAELTNAEVSDAGTLDQLERFEGMRVHVASLTAVNGTGADGAFYAVLNEQARPFREPGVESGYPVLPCAAGTCHVPVFDGNPERLRVDSDGLTGVARVDVSTTAEMNDVSGVLDFESRTFTILPDVALTPVGSMSVMPAAPAAGDQFTVASFSLGGPMTTNRLAKASAMVRDALGMPDIVGVVDAENFGALEQLAAVIDDDAAADGQPLPQYEALAIQGADPSDVHTGVLVKKAAGRVSALPAVRVGAGESIMLQATVTGPSTELPQDVTVIVTQLTSRSGSELNDDAGALVRARRKTEAEFLANFVQSRQSVNPREAIVLLGDFNAFEFNDGYVDTVGTIAGHPAAPDQVALSSDDLVTPDFVNVSNQIPMWARYSSIANGNAQALDHTLVSASLLPQHAGVVRPRVNADFAHADATDADTPSRLSDRDPMVAYFTFPADVVAPVLSNVPGDRTVEATRPEGAVVTFDTPTAMDNLDGPVAVECLPASGSTFGFGSTGVTCSAHDVAGNVATASFSVTVQDTTAPALTVPANITQEALAAAGNAVSFDVTATDAVTATPVVTCSPVSGSVFPLATTTVQCSARDAVGNHSEASFNVTVRDTTAPSLTLPADITVEANAPGGRAVSFTATATDLVPASPAVTCSPASGSVFPVGINTVQCSAQDAAGNTKTGSFLVTVQDTTPPTLTVPSNITGEATSPAGRVVTFSATATDLVTTSPTVDCAPASGSTFAVGDTVVTCAAADAAGNVATGSFTVTVTSTAPAPVFGHLAGVGSVLNGDDRVWFAFEARETSSFERGWVTVTVRGGKGRPDRYLAASVSEVQFSDSPSYTPGNNPRSGIDTVSFSGTGYWNGAAGYRFQVTATDRGEPGRDRDTFALTVFAPNGSVVEAVSGALRDGNVRSLR